MFLKKNNNSRKKKNSKYHLVGIASVTKKPNAPKLGKFSALQNRAQISNRIIMSTSYSQFPSPVRQYFILIILILKG